MSKNKVDWKEESKRFDGVAEIYARYRPSYPDQLIDHLLALTGITQTDQVLEIGCGPGIATAQMVERGIYPLCLDPSPNLLAIAADTFKATPQVKFVTSRFEEWESEQNDFDLIYSAQAFHWVPKEVRYKKTAERLKPGGWLALFWNMYPEVEGPFWQELERLYKTLTPELLQTNPDIEAYIEQWQTELTESQFFSKVDIRRTPWTKRYQAHEYLGLLNTYSHHLRLAEEKRMRLFEQIKGLIERYGGVVERPYVATLFLAQTC